MAILFSMRKWSANLVFLFISSCFHQQLADATSDTILQGQSVTFSQTIVSAGGTFELGVFSPGNSNKYYVGIWYKKISMKTVIWVANRDFPFTSSSVVLTITADGNLMILDGRISYKVTSILSEGNTNATLLDSGNFVLRNGKSSMLWQSFDDPSDTLLPGMKLGYNRGNGKKWSLVSWRSVEDPSPGGFSMELDPGGTLQINIMQGSTRYWTTGMWDGEIFSMIPEMNSNRAYKISSFFGGTNESYFSYSVINSSIISRPVLDVSGQIKLESWLEDSHEWKLIWSQPSTHCKVYAFCGAFGSCNPVSQDNCECLPGFQPRYPESWKLLDRSGGCVRKAELQCGNHSAANGDEDRFLRVSKVNLPMNPLGLQIRRARECQSICLNNCSCSAYTYENENCKMWNGDLLNVEQLSDEDTGGSHFYLKVAASELHTGVSRKMTWVWIIVAVAISLITVTLAFVIYGIWKRKLQEKGEDLLQFDLGSSSGATNYQLEEANKFGRGKKKEVELPLFSFVSVSTATNDFSPENKLGEGGFGPVHKGRLLRGYEVAVKRLSKRSGQGWEELKNEAMLIAKLQHKNLVKLLGCCIEQDEKILIYEYMPNKSLDFFLFDPTKHGILYWETRVHIIEGVAQGLLYLHQYSRLRIIHRDLKASNILLDKDMNPKISDFGMARIFGGNESKATNRIVGTYGYMSPEYALEGLFSTKSDVFSFGVLLLEILSGKKNTGFYQTDSLNLLGYAWDLWRSSRAQDLMDPVLESVSSTNALLRYINVGLLCVQESAADRPTMSDVVSMLGNESVVLPSPKQPAFSNLRSGLELHSSGNRPEVCSVNSVTLSIMEARS